MRFFSRNQQGEPKIFQSPDFGRERSRILELIQSTDDKMRAQRRVPYNRRLLELTEVTSAVEAIFGNCCAYCERPFPPGEHLRIDQHRPRSNAASSEVEDGHLYYAWLSYEWENILPVCTRCSRHKGDRFPVEKDKRGAIGASIQELRAIELPALIDPCHDDIAEHLEFTPNAHANPRSNRGGAFIEILGLNSFDQIEDRSQSFKAVAKHITQHTELYTTVPTGAPDGWSSHVLQFRNGMLGYAGAFSLALLKHCDENFWNDKRYLSSIPTSSEYTGNPILLRRILDSVIQMPMDLREELFRPFMEFEMDRAIVASSSAKAKKRSRKHKSRNIRLSDLPAARFPVQNVKIRNFKALREVEFTLPERVENPDLAPCMLILGENATGKSSVLEAIALAVLGTSEIGKLNAILEQEEVSPNEFVHRPDVDNWDKLSKDPLSVRLAFFAQETEAVLQGKPGKEQFGGDERPSKIALAYGPRRFFTKRKSRRYRAPAYRMKSLFDPMEVIANPIEWLLSLSDERRFNAAVRALRVVLMLEPEAKILREDGRILIDTPQGQTPLSKLSVGYKSIVALAVDIIREMFYHYPNLEEAHAMVIIDEIETHLHPRWKMRIVSLLREAFPKIQFIMTTHDPLCLRGMYQGEVFVLQRRSADARIESLEELPNVQGMRADQILTSEFFGLGSTDPETDAKLIRYHHLTRIPTRTDEQDAERARLGREIEEQMVVGSTMEEQVEARAVVELSKTAGFDTLPMPKIERDDRKRMLAQAMERLARDRTNS